ncbi:MAG: MATE family efflux transporter [Clostridiales bacterium]|nr:MATE family efflux transporter [Clostridiales bacterium]
MNEKNMLTQGSVGKGLLYFALPYLFSSFLQALYGMADVFMVGRFASSSAVSAVSIGSQVMQTLTGFIVALSTGGTVLIGFAVGQRKAKKVANAVGNLILIFGLCAIVVTPLMAIFAQQLASMMQTPAEAMKEARDYLFVCSLGIPFIIGYNGVSCIFRGLGDSRTPVIFVALACLINILGDYILTGLWGMGAVGTAYATIGAQAISFFCSLIYLKKKGLGVPFSRNNIRFHLLFIEKILKIGIPLAFQDFLVNGSFLLITALVNTLGLAASAAVGVVEKIIVFSMLVPMAFASAVASMTAQNLGAKQPKRAWEALWKAVGFSLVPELIFCIWVQISPDFFTMFFTEEKDVIQLSGQYLKSYSIDSVLVCFTFCMNSYFSGYGKPEVPFIHSLLAAFGVRIPLIWYYIQNFNGSMYTIGIAAPVATLASLIICLGYLIHMNKNMQFSNKVAV